MIEKGSTIKWSPKHAGLSLKMFEFSPNQAARSGFSLPEVLVVIAIMSILLAMAAGGLNRVSFSRPAPTAAEGIAGVLRSTRSFAIAQNTYAAIGLRNVTRDGSPSVELGVVYSKDGLEPGGGEEEVTNLALKDKLHRWSGVQIQADEQELEGALAAAIPDAEKMAGISDSSFAFSAPQPFGDFDWRVLITPSGEMSLQTADSWEPATLIGLAAVRAPSGTVPPAEAAVVIRSAAGQASVVLP